MSSEMALAFYGGLYLLTSIGTLFYVSAQNALIAVMGQENEDRIKLSARRVQMISVSSIVGGMIIMPMIMFVGGGDQANWFSYILFQICCPEYAMVATFFTSISIAILVGSLVGEFVAKKTSKKMGYIIGLIIMVVFLVGAYLFAGENATVFITCFSFAIFGLGIANSVPLSLYADTADYSEWKTGKNAKGIVMALYKTWEKPGSEKMWCWPAQGSREVKQLYFWLNKGKK